MSDTPRTDVAQSTIWNAYENRWQAATEAMNFARQLEREVTALKSIHLRCRNSVVECMVAFPNVDEKIRQAEAEIAALKAEVERLRGLLRECIEIGNAMAIGDGGRREWLDTRFRIRAALERKP